MRAFSLFLFLFPALVFAKGTTSSLNQMIEVWSFLKYHHPKITSGQVDWDQYLVSSSEKVLSEKSVAKKELNHWMGELGPVKACGECVQVNSKAHYSISTEWLGDKKKLGKELSQFLQLVYKNRPLLEKQHYVEVHPKVGNPVFVNEKTYDKETALQAGHRVLALARIWAIVEYWFPYRNILDADWAEVLNDHLPPILAAKGEQEFMRELFRVIAKVDDTHMNFWAFTMWQPPAGVYQLPVSLRFIEGKAVVYKYLSDDEAILSGLKLGDILEEIDSKKVSDLVEEMKGYYPASNEVRRLDDIARRLTKGPNREVSVKLLRGEVVIEKRIQRHAMNSLKMSREKTRDLPGPTYQNLDEDVGYLKLSTIEAADIPVYLEKVKDKKVFVIDIRGYPNRFVVYALGRHFVEEKTPFALFTHPDIANPGSFLWTKPQSLHPGKPFYSGKVVILVDETSLSQSEFTAMAFRSSKNAIVVGNQTAGADGNLSRFELPNGAKTGITGLGVFYPDRKPTQRIGIVPDLVVHPTMEGIRQGRDEVLEAGVSKALGRKWHYRPLLK